MNETIETCTSTQEQHTTHTQCNNMITPNQVAISQTPVDGTILQPDPRDVNLCGIKTVTGTTGYASDYLNSPVFFTIKMSANLFTNEKLPIDVYSYNPEPTCVSTSGVISITPTTQRVQIGSELWNGVSIIFYQDAGENCGVSNSNQTCHINISLDRLMFWNPITTNWTVIFPKPKLASATDNYIYTKGCP